MRACGVDHQVEEYVYMRAGGVEHQNQYICITSVFIMQVEM